MDVTIHIKLPETITVGIWSVYQQARSKYFDDIAKVNEGKPEHEQQITTELMAKYNGALTLIKQGYVKIEGLDALRAVMERADQNSIELSVIGFIVNNIARPVEDALNSPLAATYLPPSSDGKSDQRTAPVQKH